MLHTRIGTVLAAALDPNDVLAAEAARHADAGGDSVGARASVRAARRCLRLGAYRDAENHALRGRHHARRLAPESRVPIDLQLIHALLHPALRLHDPGNLASDLADLCAQGQRLDLRAELSSGLYLLARLHHWGWGDIPRARALMQRVLDVIARDGGADVDPILEAARCLAYLEIDMERTTRLFEQLAGLHDLATRSHQYQWGLGLVRAWNGDVEGARGALREAISLGAARHDHWAVFECSARLLLMEADVGDPGKARPLLPELAHAAARLGTGGSETRFASAIFALHRLIVEPSEMDAFLREVAALEAIDARFLVPELLGIAAQLTFRRADLDQASTLARRTLDIAGKVDKPNEAARAHALLACVAAGRKDAGGVMAHLRAARASASMPVHMESLLREAARLADALA